DPAHRGARAPRPAQRPATPAVPRPARPLPHALPRRERRRPEPDHGAARLPAGRRLPGLPARRGDDPVAPAGRRVDRDRHRARDRGRLLRPPRLLPRAAPRARPRPPGGGRGDLRRPDRLLPRSRPDLRRLHPGRRRRRGRGAAHRRRRRGRVRRHRPGHRAAGPERVDRAGHLPDRLRDPVRLERLLPPGPARVAAGRRGPLQPAVLHLRRDARADHRGHRGRGGPRGPRRRGAHRGGGHGGVHRGPAREAAVGV
ncbi:MAG: hypothetical protein AVDCRST_MAG79-3058, partial [uncultured Thermoleophilia bacterium]